MSPVAIYVHIPFCPSKCGYCDFNSYAMTGEIVGRTADAIQKEVMASPLRGRPSKTIFFGGGTPTFLAADAQARLLATVLDVHPPVDGCEATTEANPGTVDFPKLKALRSAGFNRLSIGAQSFDPDELRVLERVHTPSEVENAVSAARDADFDNLNLDLMFALPRQSLRRWTKNLEKAIELQPDHLSLYCLTVEPATKFYKLLQRGVLDQPDEDIQSEMYDLTVQIARSAGFERYEVSNFAQPGRECKHNLCYWRGEEYVGYGPGAVQRVGRERRTNLKHPSRYCEAVERGQELGCERELLDDRAMRLEKLMLGLRLAEGLPADEIDNSSLLALEQKGWITTDSRVKLTDLGVHFCNQATLALI
jgi:oxygen-independent coproporphyrinogen-3 oxidase